MEPKQLTGKTVDNGEKNNNKKKFSLSGFFARFGRTVAALAVTAYIGLHFALYVGEIIETENALIFRSVTAAQTTGYIFRDEEVLKSEKTGVVSQSAFDGQKVASGETVAAIYDGKESADIRDEINILTRKIKILKESDVHASVSADSLNRMDAYIGAQISEIIAHLEKNEPDFASRKGEELLVMMNRRRKLYLPEKSFENKIKEYEKRLKELRAQSGEAEEYITAPTGGFYYSRVDGYEDIFTSAAVQTLTADNFSDFISQKPSEKADSVGKIAKSARWYLAFEIDKRLAAQVTGGRTSGFEVEVEFPYFNGKKLDMDFEKLISRTDKDIAVMILSVSGMPDGFDTSRAQPIKVTAKVFEGLGVPVKALRVKDGQTGVYVIDGNVIAFRKTEVLCEDNGVYVCKMPLHNGRPVTDKEKLSLYDMIVVSGRNLYEGKILN